LARSPDGSAGGQSRGRQRRGARAGSRPRAAACARGRHIIAIDICADIDTVDYPLATPEDLDDTVAQVELLGRRVAASETDVRDATAVAAAIDTGVAKLGRSTSWSQTPGSRCTTQPTRCLRRAGAT
jgi:hypothetical protein